MCSRSGAGGTHIYERRLLDALYLRSSKSRKLENPIQNKATVDVHRGYVSDYPSQPYHRGMGCGIYISAWASALLVLMGGAMRDA